MTDYLFIGIAALLGTIIVREDITTGKIRNTLVGAGVIAGLFLYGIVFAWSLAVYFGIDSGSISVSPLSYFFYVLLNFCISALCGYLLWRYKLWSAGDAKFFIMLAFLLPLKFYENGYLPHFPSFALLTNIFIPVFLIFIFRMVFEPAMHFKKFITGEADFIEGYIAKIRKESKSFMQHKRRLLILAGTFLLTFLFIPLLKFQTILMLPPNFILVFFVFAVFYALQSYSYRLIEVFMKKKWFVAGLSLFIVGYLAVGMLYFSESMISALSMVVTAGAVFFILVSMFERISSFYIKQNEVTVIRREGLKPKMVISDDLVKIIESDVVFSQALGELYPEGISKEQVVLLQEWLKEHGKNDVPVYKTFSFAPYIFAGAIITIVLKQSVVHLFLSFIR